MDNKIFNVNGRLEDEDVLLMTLQLAMKQEWGNNLTIAGWSFDINKGMILHRFTKDNRNNLIPFPNPLTAEQLLPIVISFLNSDKAKSIECDNWDADLEHDGHNSKGWRIYTEDWGRIGDDWTSYIAIKPAYMWHGK